MKRIILVCILCIAVHLIDCQQSNSIVQHDDPQEATKDNKEQQVQGRILGRFFSPYFDPVAYKENILHNKISFLFSLVPRLPPRPSQTMLPPYPGVPPIPGVPNVPGVPPITGSIPGIPSLPGSIPGLYPGSGGYFPSNGLYYPSYYPGPLPVLANVVESPGNTTAGTTEAGKPKPTTTPVPSTPSTQEQTAEQETPANNEASNNSEDSSKFI